MQAFSDEKEVVEVTTQIAVTISFTFGTPKPRWRAGRLDLRVLNGTMDTMPTSGSYFVSVVPSD